ncbi:agmatinase [Planotetraspora thailandica]|uniref:Agmatinase n=1 Tax=Planotetraspora thailandica TaxID=487172 RepID=A0A8J3XZ16_9ACTN|nr:agmatinase [Planotetraspora thailandica]GII55803.1 agmatinase [Planotetraspora thailandica]
MPEHSDGGPIGPVDASLVPRYGGAPTFARLPRLDQVDHADVALLGVPFDSGVSYRPGARFGPGHIRQSSRLLRPFDPALRAEPFAEQQVVDAGDVVCNPFDIKAAIDSVHDAARDLLARGTRVVALGGDHTIALGMLRAMAGHHGPVAVLHFDAHLDTWETYFGEPYTHGTPFRRAAEEGLLDERRCAHVGIRGPLYSALDLEKDEQLGFRVFSADDVEAHGAANVARGVRERLGGGPVYISIDIDVLDPAHAPGTGTPEIGGLSSRELQVILRALAGLRIVGADVVEVSPAYDHAEISGIAAANVAYTLLSLLAVGSRPAG